MPRPRAAQYHRGMPRLSSLLVALLVILAPAGCATFGTTMEDLMDSPSRHEYFSGTRLHWDAADDGWTWNEEAPGGPAWTPVRKLWIAGFVLVDVPLSLGADLAVLPFKFLARLVRGDPGPHDDPRPALVVEPAPDATSASPQEPPS